MVNLASWQASSDAFDMLTAYQGLRSRGAPPWTTA